MEYGITFSRTDAVEHPSPLHSLTHCDSWLEGEQMFGPPGALERLGHAGRPRDVLTTCQSVRFI